MEKRDSSIDTSDQRVATIRSLSRGMHLLGGFVGSLRSPIDHTGLVHRLVQIIEDREYGDPDLFFRLIKKNLPVASGVMLDVDFGDKSDINRNIGEELLQFSNHAETRAAVSTFEGAVDVLSTQPDTTLIALARSRVIFDHRPFSSGRNSCLYAKVNHGYWEHLTNLHFDQVGLRYYRSISPVVPTRNYEQSGFNFLFFSAAQKHFSNPADEMRFGMAFDAGDGSTSSYSYPLIPVVRGAIIGALAFLETVRGVLSSKAVATVAAGSIPKDMLLDNSLSAFVRKVALDSELVMFIAPNHLRTITVAGLDDVAQSVFVLPSAYVHELWMPVLAMAAASLETAVTRYRAVTVFTQAGVMSYLLMLLARHIHARFAPGCTLRYFDLGQAMDIATLKPGFVPRQPWVRDNSARLAGIENPFRLLDPSPDG